MTLNTLEKEKEKKEKKVPRYQPSPFSSISLEKKTLAAAFDFLPVN